jgi:hypothetical protein
VISSIFFPFTWYPVFSSLFCVWIATNNATIRMFMRISLRMGAFIFMSVLVSYSSLWSNTWEVNLREEGFILAHCFSPCFWACGEAQHHGGRVWCDWPVQHMAVRKQSRDRKEPGQDMSFKGHPLWPTSSNQAPPLHFATSQDCSTFESINGLNHWLGQSPYNLITSGVAPIDIPRGVLH